MYAITSLLRLSISLICLTQVVQAGPKHEVNITPGPGLPPLDGVGLSPETLYKTAEGLQEKKWATRDVRDLALPKHSNSEFHSGCGIDGAQSLNGKSVYAAPLKGAYACYLYLRAVNQTICTVQKGSSDLCNYRRTSRGQWLQGYLQGLKSTPREKGKSGKFLCRRCKARLLDYGPEQHSPLPHNVGGLQFPFDTSSPAR
ncbi:hypothetical protein B0T14DRAFT_494033 [Immersiella caudata]|uniref:Uncharacterized protein n=1 Tax=Immersiella caudata TaxID=314043 RepID=A0AA40C2W9_9PEZI|nr:hypothetical protein B0T14DRAFT_494033 [Immersiella caudata]